MAMKAAFRPALIALVLALLAQGCADDGAASDNGRRGGFYGGVSGGRYLALNQRSDELRCHRQRWAAHPARSRDPFTALGHPQGRRRAGREFRRRRCTGVARRNRSRRLAGRVRRARRPSLSARQGSRALRVDAAALARSAKPRLYLTIFAPRRDHAAGVRPLRVVSVGRGARSRRQESCADFDVDLTRGSIRGFELKRRSC